MTALREALADTAYAGYAYSYPHKTAHRPFPEPVPLRALWRDEPRSRLFLYLHSPFCARRCAYCNLFSLPRPGHALVDAYLRALRRQAEVVRRELAPLAFSRMAVGGGTPTFLPPERLRALLSVATEVLGVDPRAARASVEVSPATVTDDRLRVLRALGVTRVSVGVQTFEGAELSALGRGEEAGLSSGAVARVREAGFDTLNIDLMYGLPGQTEDSWLRSLREALRFRPEELYLYPLYVRPRTGLAGLGDPGDAFRLGLYRGARAVLLEAGYRQASMRMFRLPGAAAAPGPAYRCQEDGMIGLGCGPRSYTRGTHYSSRYAVSRDGTLAILEDYVRRDDRAFAAADHGIRLDREDQSRRFVIQSLLIAEGLSLRDYRARFGADAFEDLPPLRELEPAGLAEIVADRLRLTADGLERSDVIGPWLYSDRVRHLMERYEWTP